MFNAVLYSIIEKDGCKNYGENNTYKETKDAHLVMLGTAEQLLAGLGEKGIRGQDRDFTEILDVNRAAIAAFNMVFEFPLSQEWNEM